MYFWYLAASVLIIALCIVEYRKQCWEFTKFISLRNHREDEQTNGIVVEMLHFTVYIIITILFCKNNVGIFRIIIIINIRRIGLSVQVNS